MKPPLTILKIGGSVITDRRKERPRFREKVMIRIAREIAEAWDPDRSSLLLIHGAGSFGHPIVKRTGLDRGLEGPGRRVAMGETQLLQCELNVRVVRLLLRAGLPAFPYQPSASAVMEATRLLSLATEALEGLLDSGLVPVLNGVPAHDRARGVSILSGDQIAAFLFRRLGARRVLHGTDVEGLYTSDPSRDPAARFLPRVDLDEDGDLPEGVAGSSVTDVTGGMRAKLEEMRRVGARGRLFDATTPGNVRRALAGEPVGTELAAG